eukprot:NODE_226_length_13883_cov_0.528729.p10 type:complete len:152 gc:universal NODE_226_length_13883_cov_0.528729:3902-3447(-)
MAEYILKAEEADTQSYSDSMQRCEWKNCSFIAGTEDDIYRHAISVHTQHGIKPKCLYGNCDYMTSNRYRLKTHLKSHFDVKNFECKICGSKYKHRYNLSRHIKSVHSGDPIDMLLFDNQLEVESPTEYSRPQSRWFTALDILFDGIEDVFI